MRKMSTKANKAAAEVSSSSTSSATASSGVGGGVNVFVGGSPTTTTNTNGTPQRRLRTRTSQSNSGSDKKNERLSSTTNTTSATTMTSASDSNNISLSNNPNIVSTNGSSSASTNLEESSKKKQQFVRNSSNKPSSHTQPHSSSTFSQNKNEEFHFDTPRECPVFRPTTDEFRNPLAYISKIRPIAEKCGIAKILPPAEWRPPFAVDVDKLKFTPRVQRLNELEAKTRVKLNFLDQIAKFWELQGASLKIPMVERKALDLYSLHRIVQEEGGMEQATRERKWAKVANRMSYPSSKSVGATLRMHYERLLHPYNVYTSGKIIDMKLDADAAGQDDCKDYKSHEIVSRQQITPPNETTARRSKRFALGKGAVCGLGATTSSSTSSSTGSGHIETKEDFKRNLMATFNDIAAGGAASKKTGGTELVDPLMKYICHICNRGDSEENMLLCDGCDDSYHTFCLIPALGSIPKGEWLCPRCVVEEVSKPTEAFGFEQAEREYTLQQFGEMADQFKADYFRKPVHMVSTDLVEREFWRIVSSIDEDVTVEYGADLHTMDHGSGFPTKSSLYLLPSDQEYAESPWNLNNLPLLEDSILGHINADISGMNAPWMYVGMCFAAFCWHNEDHWSYSINYLHWGEPKTWYGVPGSCAEAFEETMKKAAPELFASQPDLLHQLVTIMNPNILMNNGVPVFRTDQNAGEFVITFPRAYHAGFNQGYNFAEAVNFAPADWLKMGRECVNHYSILRRFCVFSHDELVCKMALEPNKLTFGIATACYIDMAEMVDSEKKLRKSLLEWGVTRAERKAFELIPDDERHCLECNTTCFLSAVSCECKSSIVCLRHYTALCFCAAEKHTLQYRYTLDEMPLMLQKLKAKAQSFERWLSRCRNIIDTNTPTVVTLAELQELTKEAELKKFPSSMLIDRLNAAVLEAEKCVTVIQQLGINKVRTRLDHSIDAAQYKLTMEELELFAQEIDNLCCIIEEGRSVRELLAIGKDFVSRAKVMLAKPLDVADEKAIETLVDDGCVLRIEMQELIQLGSRLKAIKWIKRSEMLRDSTVKMTCAEIKNLLLTGQDLDSDPAVDNEMRLLQQILGQVDAWEKMAAKYFRGSVQHDLQEIEMFLKSGDEINGQLASYGALKDAIKKAKEWLRSVEALQANDHFPYCHTLEEIVQRGRNIPIQLEELFRMEGHLKSAKEWKENTAKAFLKKNTYYTLLEVLMPRDEPVVIDSHSKIPFEADFLKDMNPTQILDSFKIAEEKEIRNMRELRRLNMGKNPLKDDYCICNSKFHGVMFNCQLCKDWFHEDCVKEGSSKSRSSSSTPTLVGSPAPPPTLNGNLTKPKFLCSSCVRSKRPRLETILPLLVSLQKLPIRLPEDEALRCLAERAMHWQDRAQKALSNPEIASVLESITRTKSKQEKPVRRNHHLQQQQRKTIAHPEKQSSISDGEDLDHEDEDEDDDDDEGRLRIDLDGFSDDEDSSQNLLGEEENTKNFATLKLTDMECEAMEELMMEGDLLEVSLDVSQELWRLIKASYPHTSPDLAARYQQTFNFPSEESNDSLVHQHTNNNSSSSSGSGGVNAIKKRRSLDPAALCPVPRKKTATPNKLQQSNNKKSIAGRRSEPTKQTTTTTISTEDNTENNTPTQTKGGATNTKKRKRAVNKKLSQRAQQAQQEDDEEECRAENCHKPTGREVDWVQCDGGCNEWFHMYCVGLNRSQIKADDDYICIRCAKANPSQQNTNKNRTQTTR
ncbi:lysine-specific demethylase lid [Episyrphus balteatus]|uniref:lysine-specific demethylase lid n=1 Tax=Episyrphus balteatus TaxID=286459 RepID=UPI002485F3D6|nr:lysine-specific demethylase lid [Episyrphus balteatus]